MRLRLASSVTIGELALGDTVGAGAGVGGGVAAGAGCICGG